MKQFLVIFLFAAFMGISLNSCGDKEEIKPIDEVTEEQADDAFDSLTEEATEEEATETEDPATPAQTVQTDFTKTPLTGRVVSLNDVAMGNPKAISRATANDLTNAGGLLVFLADNGNVYMVYNEDGSYASAKLINRVGDSKVQVFGKAQTRDGLRIIIASDIKAG